MAPTATQACNHDKAAEGRLSLHQGHITRGIVCLSCGEQIKELGYDPYEVVPRLK